MDQHHDRMDPGLRRQPEFAELTGRRPIGDPTIGARPGAGKQVGIGDGRGPRRAGGQQERGARRHRQTASPTCHRVQFFLLAVAKATAPGYRYEGLLHGWIKTSAAREMKSMALKARPEARPDRLTVLTFCAAACTVILTGFTLWALRHILTPIALAAFLLLLIDGLARGDFSAACRSCRAWRASLWP